MRDPRHYFVYIVGSISGTLYIGLTNNLDRRVLQHKQHEIEGFTKDYDVDRLLFFESYDDVRIAINREKQLKGWRREKKVALIEKINPAWADLTGSWGQYRGPSTRAATAPTPGAEKVAVLAQDDSGKK